MTQDNKKGIVATWILGIIGAITMGYASLTTATLISHSETNAEQNVRISVNENDNENMEKFLEKIDEKLDKLLLK